MSRSIMYCIDCQKIAKRNITFLSDPNVTPPNCFSPTNNEKPKESSFSATYEKETQRPLTFKTFLIFNLRFNIQNRQFIFFSIDASINHEKYMKHINDFTCY